MRKKKIEDDIDVLPDFKHPGLKRIADIKIKAPAFYLSDIPILTKRDVLNDLRAAIFNLDKNKCLIVSTKDTGMTLIELQQRVTNIASNHKKKFIEKDFSTRKIDNETLCVLRK